MWIAPGHRVRPTSQPRAGRSAAIRRPLQSRLFDYGRPDSWVNQLRNRRFQLFQSLIAPLQGERPLTILDLGGTPEYWLQRGLADDPKLQITVLNLTGPTRTVKRIHCLVGDATDLSQYSANQFDVVFSNSVIEHLGNWSAQQQMASETRRVGRGYFVQTPARSFPIEPHVLLPGFQFLNTRTQRWLLTQTSLSGLGRMTPDAAVELTEELRLLSGREVRELFPGATVYRETVGGLAKSYTAHAIGE